MESSKITLASILSLSFLLGSCGGPTLEAKTANSLQTLLSYTAEAFLFDGGGGQVSQACSGGGTLSYDATSLPEVIDPDVNSIDINITFDDCIFKICDDEITLKSSSTTTTVKILGLDTSDVANLIGGGSLVAEDDQFFEVEVIAVNQEVSGFINGSISFGYRMRIIGNTAGLKDISILDSERADALTVQKKAYPAADLKNLADRC